MLYERNIYKTIKKYLNTDNIIVLHGARQVGKTSILLYLKNELEKQNDAVFYLDLEDSRYVDLLNKGTDFLIKYLEESGVDLKSSQKTYVIVDEIQYLDNPSPFLKLTHDHHKDIQLIVSGSSSFEIKSKFSDSLVGRTINFEIYNLSFDEFLMFKNETLSTKNISSQPHIEKLKMLYEQYILYGGYPKIVLENSVERKETYLRQIVDTYVRKDIRDLARIKDISKFNSLLVLLASQTGQILNVASTSDTLKISAPTIRNWLSILEATYVIKLVTPFSRNSKVEISKSPKVFFYDTGLLQILSSKGLGHRNIGGIFESNVFAELIKTNPSQNINFYRTKLGAEIDFILEQNNGEILPVEVKMNFRKFNKKAIFGFMNKYKIENYKVVGLVGDKKDNHYIFPWELSSMDKLVTYPVKLPRDLKKQYDNRFRKTP